MGQRSGSETVTAILVAFWNHRTWSQANLARHLGVKAQTVRRHLLDLEAAGCPLERQEDHPHVYWSVPKGWFPGGVMLEPGAVASLLRLLVRMPPSRERSGLLEAVARYAPPLLVEAIDRVIPPRTTDVEEQELPALLDGLAEERPLRMRYFSASQGHLANRTVSVQRVLAGPPTRFVAWCHQKHTLRFFRLDNASSLAPDPTAAFHAVEDAIVDAFVTESVDGFHGGRLVRVAFFVSDPDARWVAGNLPEGLKSQRAPGGIVVEADTAGLVPVARFVVGLGAAAECRTPELAALVRAHAEGALR